MATTHWWERRIVQSLLAVGGLIGLGLGGIEVYERATNDSPETTLSAEESAVAELGCAAELEGSVPIEGSLGVVNISRDGTEYSRSTRADAGDTLQFQIWVHNRSFDLPVENLRARLVATSQAQQSHIVEMQLCGSNSGLLRDVVSIQTDASSLHLDFVEGTSNIRTMVGDGQAHDRGGSDNLFADFGESLGRLDASPDPAVAHLTIAVQATVRGEG